MTSPAGRFLPAASVRVARCGDEAVLLDVDCGKYFTVDAIGARIWERLAEGCDLETIRRGLVDSYGIGDDVAERDLERFVAALRSEGLLVPRQ